MLKNCKLEVIRNFELPFEVKGLYDTYTLVNWIEYSVKKDEIIVLCDCINEKGESCYVTVSIDNTDNNIAKLKSIIDTHTYSYTNTLQDIPVRITIEIYEVNGRRHVSMSIDGDKDTDGNRLTVEFENKE